MKKWVIPAVFVQCMLVTFACADKGYIDLEFKQLKLAPENYKGKKVVYEAAFIRATTTFEGYMQKSGFKPEDYIRCVFGGPSVPVIIRKTDQMTKFVTDLKAGHMVKIYGVVKKFAVEPSTTVFPSYYVSVDHIERVEAEDQADEGEKPPRPPLRRRRLWR
jgi:hypothetical protein